MRYLARLRFIFTAVLMILAALTASEVRAQTGTAGQVLISEFRFSGPAGDQDEYVELYCNRDADCDISNYAIRGFDPSIGDYVALLPTTMIVPARGHLLIANTLQYSLSSYAHPDLDVNFGSDFFIDNEGLQLLDDTQSVVIDSVGFAGGGNEATYVEGTGLQRTTGARPAAQYAYVRKMGTASSGTPQDTNNNANDFALVSVTGQAHPGIAAAPALGAPGPENLTSPVLHATTINATLIDPCQTATAAPNRGRNTSPYTDPAAPTGSGTGTYSLGTLYTRRRFTNNTGGNVTRLRFRIVDVTAGSAPTGTADIRAITSQSTVATISAACGGATLTVNGITLETPPAQPNGGGLNSTLSTGTVSLAQPLLPGASIDVQFLLGVRQGGSFRFLITVEAAP
jgi:hypothetical protein